MSTLLAPEAAAPVVLGRPSLLRAEARRLRSRRMVLVLLALAALGLLAVVAIASTQFAKPSAAVTAAATERRQAFFDEQQRYRELCLSDTAGRPAGVTPEQFCGPVGTVEDFGRVEDFVDKSPFRLREDGLNGLLGISAATGALAFLVGATYVGAEWSTRSMVALLFWEPRRLKVMGTKLAVLAAACALLGVVATGAWLLAARGLLALHGSGATPAGTWPDLLAGAGRGVLFVVLVGLLGFGVANLLRNTAAAFGFGFVYFAVLENVVRALRPTWQPYLLSDNAAALLTEGGHRIFLPEPTVDGGVFSYEGREVVLANVHGGLVLGAVVLVVVALGVLLFARRDLD